jgi:hypothetical protein
MNRTTVESSTMRSVGYDPQSRMMEIEFTSGHVYQYSDVPPEVYQGLVDAESQGRYFRQHIRGVFPSQRLGKRARG